MITYELALLLKGAGFPREVNKKEWIKIPTLSELIEAIKGYVVLERGKNYWICFLRENPLGQENGDTPEEAVSKLWLALNKKK